MKPAVWQYEDPQKQTVHFRGYVKTYQGATLTKVFSPEVRKSRFQAMKDAERILKDLRKAHVTT